LNFGTVSVQLPCNPTSTSWSLSTICVLCMYMSQACRKWTCTIVTHLRAAGPACICYGCLFSTVVDITKQSDVSLRIIHLTRIFSYKDEQTMICSTLQNEGLQCYHDPTNRSSPSFCRLGRPLYNIKLMLHYDPVFFQEYKMVGN